MRKRHRPTAFLASLLAAATLGCGSETAPTPAEGAPVGLTGASALQPIGPPVSAAPAWYPELSPLPESVDVRFDNGDRQVASAELQMFTCPGGAAVDDGALADWSLTGSLPEGFAFHLQYRVTGAESIASGVWSAAVWRGAGTTDNLVAASVSDPCPSHSSRRILTGQLEVTVAHGLVWGRFETEDEIGSFEFFGRIAVQCFVCRDMSRYDFANEACQPFAALARPNR